MLGAKGDLSLYIHLMLDFSELVIPSQRCTALAMQPLAVGNWIEKTFPIHKDKVYFSVVLKKRN